MSKDGKSKSSTDKLVKDSNIISHSENVNAVMLAIKPGVCSILAKKFSKEMVYNYLHGVKHEQEYQMEMKKPMS